MAKTCQCGAEITTARLAALPHTETCPTCSTEEPVKGHVYWIGKHTPVLEVMTGELPVTRRGFHAQLGFNSVNNPRMVASMANLNLSQQIKLEVPVDYELATHAPSRCHPGRPRINPKGDCLECAVAWYADRRR